MLLQQCSASHCSFDVRLHDVEKVSSTSVCKGLVDVKLTDTLLYLL
jgi:hypothetical protein